jgi:hypothetical protein
LVRHIVSMGSIAGSRRGGNLHQASHPSVSLQTWSESDIE